MQIVGNIFLLIIFTFLLVKSADLTLESLKSLAKKLNIHTFAISAIVLSVATSLPEIFVGVSSALEGSSALSLGNVMGANIANLSLVVGISALVSGGIYIHEKALQKEILLAGAAAILPVILMYDRTLGRTDGLILIAIYLGYTTSFFKIRFQSIGNHVLNGKFLLRFVKKVDEVEQKVDKTLGHLFVGIAALLFTSNFIVKFSKDLAEASGTSIFVIGAVLLSIGTTLPELAVSIESLKKKASGVFFGNILGSLIVNSTLVLGLASVISPIRDIKVSDNLSSLGVLLLVFCAFLFFTRTKLRLERWEAMVLLIIYLLFALFWLI